jgi:hypothetical protein
MDIVWTLEWVILFQFYTITCYYCLQLDVADQQIVLELDAEVAVVSARDYGL